MRSFREDVHVHASAADVYALLARFADADRWLPHAFRDVRVHADGMTFALGLPGRTEHADLALAEQEPNERLVLRPRNGPNGRAAGLDTVAWIVTDESTRESHLTVEAFYRPMGGPLGPLLDLALHRPHRQQAFRDALWRFKLLIEGRD